MKVVVDLYKELEIDRAWDEETIKKRLREIQKIWNRRQSACNDKEQLLNIEKILNLVESAYTNLTRKNKREKYNKALDDAYSKGFIKDNAEEKIKSFLEQAREYYSKGNISFAINFAEKAIASGINDSTAYSFLARCYFENNNSDKALEIIDLGINIFANDLNLYWLGARIAAIDKKYDNAQKRINDLIEADPNWYVGYAEQIYLHLREGKESIAFDEIDDYIRKNPNNNEFKREIAYNLCEYSNKCYYYYETENSPTFFIADKNEYLECIRLRKKALEIYSDEFVESQLKNAQFFGKKIFDDLNLESIITLFIVWIAIFYLSKSIGIILFAFIILLIFASFRPRWKIWRTRLTGKYDIGELIICYFGAFLSGLLDFEALGGWIIGIAILIIILNFIF